MNGRTAATTTSIAVLVAVSTACGTVGSEPTSYTRANSAGGDRHTASATTPPITSAVRPADQLPAGADTHGFVGSSARCDGTDAAIMLIGAGTPGEAAQFAVCVDAFTGRYLRAFAPPESTDSDPNPARIPMRGTFFTDTASSVQFMVDETKVDISETTVTIVWPKRGSRTHSTSWTGFQRWKRP